MEEDYEESSINLDVEGSSFHEQTTNPSSPILPSHTQQQTNDLRQTRTVSLAVKDYQLQLVVKKIKIKKSLSTFITWLLLDNQC